MSAIRSHDTPRIFSSWCADHAFIPLLSDAANDEDDEDEDDEDARGTTIDAA